MLRASVTHGNGGTLATPSLGRLLGSKLVREGARLHPGSLILASRASRVQRMHALVLAQTGSSRQNTPLALIMQV